jgi:hypothetical protein
MPARRAHDALLSLESFVLVGPMSLFNVEDRDDYFISEGNQDYGGGIESSGFNKNVKRTKTEMVVSKKWDLEGW